MITYYVEHYNTVMKNIQKVFKLLEEVRHEPIASAIMTGLGKNGDKNLIRKYKII